MPFTLILRVVLPFFRPFIFSAVALLFEATLAILVFLYEFLT